jgi:hypothetical protein
MRRRPAVLPALAAAVALVAGLAGTLAVAAPAQAAATRTVKATVLGSDGRAVGVFVGVDLQDAAGRALDANGCLQSRCGKTGYAKTLRLNPQLGPAGSASRAGHTTDFSLTVPANAAKVFIEAYPRNTGLHGTTNDARYGRALRRLAMPYSGTAHVRLPLQCGAGGGTGTLAGYTTVGGVRKQVNRISAFSIGADNNTANPILGFNIGTSASNGSFRIPSLAPGTKYRVFTKRTASSPPRSQDFVVGRCRTTTVNVAG